MRGGKARLMSKEIDDILNSIPTLGSIRERLSYFACKTEAGELNTTLNNAMLYVEKLEKELSSWRTVAKMMIAQVDPESPAWAEYWKVQRGEQ